MGRVIVSERSKPPSTLLFLSLFDLTNIDNVASLAYAEMRLLLCRLIWNFDLRLDEASKDWMDNNRLYTLWEKGPLKIYLTPRKVE